MTVQIIFTGTLFLIIAGLVTACIGVYHNSKQVANTGYGVAIFGFAATVVVLSTASISILLEALLITLQLTLGILLVGSPLMAVALLVYLKLKESPI